VIDKGDVVEIPIVEERLVKQPVVTEVLRVHKTLRTERRTVEADVRKEDVEVEGTGDAEIRDHS
jgi:stress response protein YsnF